MRARAGLAAAVGRLAAVVLTPLSQVLRLPRPLGRWLGRFHATRGDHERAVAVLARTESVRRPPDAGLLHLLGLSQFKTGCPVAAEQSFRQAVALAPRAACSYQGLGEALMSQGRFVEAEFALRDGLRNQPCNPWLHYHLSGCLFRQGRTGDALDAAIEGSVSSTSGPLPGVPFPIQALPEEVCTPARLSVLRKLMEQYPRAEGLMALASWMLTAHRDYAGATQVMRRMAPLHWDLDVSEQTVEAAMWKPPAFLVVGQPVAGAAPLFRYLDQHPRFVPPLFRKSHYWSRHFAAGEDWYRACLPPLHRDSGLITGDGSTDYFSNPDAPGRIAQALPGIKLILFLRDPIDCAYAQYQLYRRVGLEHRPWAEIVAEGLAAMPVCPLTESDAAVLHGIVSPNAYLWRALALPFLMRWLALFPRKQVLILTHAGLVSDPRATLGQVIEFLGLCECVPDCHEQITSGRQPPMASDIEQRLRTWILPHQQALTEHLNDLGVWA